jgi:hypothetical protein
MINFLEQILDGLFSHQCIFKERKSEVLLVDVCWILRADLFQSWQEWFIPSLAFVCVFDFLVELELL